MAALAREAGADTNFRSFVLRGFAAYPDKVEAWARIPYRYREEIEETVRTPQRMLEDLSTLGYMEGDCDDISTFLAAMYRVLQVPVRFVLLRVSDPSEFEHVYVEWFSPRGDSWQVVDLTVPSSTRHEWLERMEVDV